MRNRSEATYQILLVEEDPLQMDLYSNLIREIASSKVDVVSHFDHSFDWLAGNKYHLVIVDLGKKGDGLNILERIKQISPSTGVILLADRPTIEQAVNAIRLGAEDYLKKPFNLESFQQAIRRGLDRKKVFSEDAEASSFLTLLASCQMISASMDQLRIFNIIHGYLSGELSVRYSAIYRIDAEGPKRVDSFSRESAKDGAMEEILDFAVSTSGMLPKMEAKSDVYRFSERSGVSPALFCFRFRVADQNNYFYVGLSPKKPTGLSEFESRLKLLKSQIEVTGKNIEQYRGVEHLIYVDDVTGLYNTRYLGHILEREIAQADAAQRAFAILFIDVDRFKSINDTHGHMVGSKILSELGAVVRSQVRDSDTVFRYGGDEFVAVLSGCDLVTAEAVAERVRDRVQKTEFLKGDGLNLNFTISIGVALYPIHARSKQEIIDAADHAMYASKRRTRNQVSIAELPKTEVQGTPEPTVKTGEKK